ncbi:MAG: hypothetical protein CUN55_16250, partial [Phototrophicales bacterium]
MENIQFDGGSISTGSGSDSISFNHIGVNQGAINRNRLIWSDSIAVFLRGNNHSLTNSTLRQTDGTTVRVDAQNTVIENNAIYESLHQGVDVDKAYNATIRDNTIFDIGNSAIAIGAKASLITGNHTYHSGMRITDIATMNTWNSGDMQGTEISYNWVHSSLAPRDGTLSWWGGQGIRLDSGGAEFGCSNTLIHHNVVWGTTSESAITAWALDSTQLNYNDAKIYVYQNTVAGKLVVGRSGDTTSSVGNFYKRNIARSYIGDTDEAVVEENLFYEDNVPNNLFDNPDFIS